MLRWLLLGSFFLACASQEPEKVYYVSPDFTEEEFLAIELAASEWRSVVEAPIGVVRGIGYPGISRVVRGSAEWRAQADSVGEEFLGVYWSPGGNITLSVGYDLELFRVVALHELGHAYGLGHTPAPSVMHAQVATAWSLTRTDLLECVAAGACREDKSLEVLNISGAHDRTHIGAHTCTHLEY